MPATPATHVYKTATGCEIGADVYGPAAGTSAGPAPAIVWIHGGCLMYGSCKGIHPRQLELYTRAGYAIVSIDYRLAPESLLPDIVEDLRDAFAWVRGPGAQEHGIDPERIAVVGHSAGGYLAQMSGVCVAPRPRAIVSFYGYGDIVGDWYAKPDPFYCKQPAVSEEESGRLTKGPVISEPYEGRGKDKFYLYCRQHGFWQQEVGGHDPPTLLLHGDRDTDVPYEQSVLMAEELARHGVEHELVTMLGRGHGFDGKMDDPVVRDAFDKTLRFLDSRTKRKAQ